MKHILYLTFLVCTINVNAQLNYPPNSNYGVAEQRVLDIRKEVKTNHELNLYLDKVSYLNQKNIDFKLVIGNIDLNVNFIKHKRL